MSDTTAASVGSYIDDLDLLLEETDRARLGRDLTDPDVEPTGDDLARWMLDDSRLPTGLATLPGESERPFGLELEFVFDVNLLQRERDERLQRIVDDLRGLGLTEQTTAGGEHSARAAGYVSHRSGWHVEADHTVDGEVVSPILPYRDGTLAERERVWFDVAVVLGVIRRNGGLAHRRAGGHVHVGIGDYGRDVGSLIRLLDVFRAHQDSLYRLATAVGQRFHRGTFHARPLDDAQRRRALSGQGDWHDFLAGDLGPGSYDQALSRVPLQRGFEAGEPAEADHVEFRLWDGALSLGEVRAHVALSRALVDTALAGGKVERESAEVGSGFLAANLLGEHDASALRGVLKLFPPDAEELRRQVTHWWERTVWQPPNGGLTRRGWFLWATTEPSPVFEWDGFHPVAAEFPHIQVIVYRHLRDAASTLPVDALENTLQGWVDGAHGAAMNAATRSLIVAVADSSRAADLDVLPERFGVALVRPVTGTGSVEPATPNGWSSSTGWELVTRNPAPVGKRLGDLFGPGDLRRVLAQVAQGI